MTPTKPREWEICITSPSSTIANYIKVVEKKDYDSLLEQAKGLAEAVINVLSHQGVDEVEEGFGKELDRLQDALTSWSGFLKRGGA